MTRASFDKTAVRAAFQVVDARNVIAVVETEGVSHQNQVHLTIVLQLDRVDTVNARDK